MTDRTRHEIDLIDSANKDKSYQKNKLKQYKINSMPIMSRDTFVYAKDEDEAWEIYYGNKKGKIEQSDIGDLKYTDFNDYVDPEIEEIKE